MEAAKQEYRRTLVRDYLLLNPDSSCKDAVNHFVSQGMNKRTVYRYIKRIKEHGDTKSRYVPGKKQLVLTKRMKNRLYKLFDGKVGVSVRQALQKLNVCQSVIKRWLNELGIKRKVRQVVPKSSEKQRKKQAVILHKIARKEFRVSNDSTKIIMDDETYFNLSGHDFKGNKFYFDSGLQTIPENVKFRKKKNSSQKFFFGWQSVLKDIQNQ